MGELQKFHSSSFRVLHSHSTAYSPSLLGTFAQSLVKGEQAPTLHWSFSALQSFVTSKHPKGSEHVTVKQVPEIRGTGQTRGVPAQAPLVQTSLAVQARPSSHVLPLGFGTLMQVPLAGLHWPLLQGSDSAEQSVMVPASHWPFLHTEKSTMLNIVGYTEHLAVLAAAAAAAAKGSINSRANLLQQQHHQQQDIARLRWVAHSSRQTSPTVGSDCSGTKDSM